MNLNEDYTKLDPSGVEKSLMSFPEQIKTTFSQGKDLKVSMSDFENIVISGMGGSSNAGKLVQGLLEVSYKKPIFVFNDYGLPSWVNEKTLVILNSYSGNTEETVSSYVRAKELGSQIVAIATGGKLGELIQKGEVSGVTIDPKDTNPTGFPKTGLGVSLGALLGVLFAINVLPDVEIELENSLTELVSIRNSWNAKEIATWLHGSIPVLFTGRPLLGSLNAGRNAMCEISRNFTEFYDFPEVDHVLIEAVGKPETAIQKKYLFFESKFNHERVNLRYTITKDIFSEQGLQAKSYQLVSKTALGQALELAHYCSWLGFYISILDDTDPEPEPWILKLKSALSQPVH